MIDLYHQFIQSCSPRYSEVISPDRFWQSSEVAIPGQNSRSPFVLRLPAHPTDLTSEWKASKVLQGLGVSLNRTPAPEEMEKEMMLQSTDSFKTDALVCARCYSRPILSRQMSSSVLAWCHSRPVLSRQMSSSPLERHKLILGPSSHKGHTSNVTFLACQR